MFNFAKYFIKRGGFITEFSFYLSALFLSVGIISLIYGMHVLSNNIKDPASKAFLGIAISSLFWSLGFAIATSAANSEISLLGHRVASLGWGSVFSVLLHFSLILTGKRNVLKKWWIYPIIYFPAVILVCAFMIPNKFNFSPYQLVHTSLGWVNIATNPFWSWFDNLYYLSFVSISLMLIYKWGKNSSSSNNKHQSKAIIISFLIALFIGTLTDKIFVIISVRVPQMAPLAMVIPIIAFYFSTKRYGFLTPKRTNNDESILDESTYKNVYCFISFIFISGSIINFILQYVYDQMSNIININLLSLLFLLVALIIWVIDKLRIDYDTKELSVAMVFAVVIPIGTLQYGTKGSTSIWAFSLVLMIICLLFNKKTLLTSIALSSVLTQLLVWAIEPNVSVNVAAFDYLVRIIIFIVAIHFALYVNNIYILRLKGEAHQIKFRKLLLEISNESIYVDSFNLDKKVYEMLGKCGMFLNVDMAYVVLFHGEQKEILFSCEWCKEENGVKNKKEFFSMLYSYQIMIDRLISNLIFKVDDANHLYKGELKKQLSDNNIKGMISLPIKENGNVVGFIGFSSNAPISRWNIRSVSSLSIFANLTSDILNKINSEKKINYLAYYDQLTGLPNRILFRDIVDKNIEMAKETSKTLAIVLFDLDSFKFVNDTVGHESGDKLLIKVAEILSRSIGSSDVVSRLDGDEFIVMLNEFDKTSDVMGAVKKMIDALNKPIILKEQEFFISASAGIACYPNDGKNAEELFQNADFAMYKAKSDGKNRYALCSYEIKGEEFKKIKLTNLLYHALERNELLIYYQPQVSLKTNKIVGMEALLRWNLPEIGMVGPFVFIPLAERSGLINPIGEWVLRSACIQNRAWQDMGIKKLRMGVNVSIYQLRNPNLIFKIDNILKETRLSPDCLDIEITESAAINNEDKTIKVLEKIKELGVTISIDDFGTEYSSMSRLKSLPIDRIKIDKRFIQNIENDDKDKAVTKIIINLAKELNLKVIAEGAETTPQLDFLNQKMCDEVQGFFYYKPMPAEDIEKILLREYRR